MAVPDRPFVLCRTPVHGPSTWRAADFDGPRDWTRTLSASEAESLVEAVTRAGSRGATPGTISADDFPLGLAGEAVRAARDDVERGRGFAVLAGLPIGSLDRAGQELLLSGLGTHIGEAVRQNAAGELIASVRDYGHGDLNSGAQRGYQTSTSLPFHTDSSDVVGLLCLETSGSGGRSMLASAMTIHNELLEHHRELLGLYYAGFFYDRRGEEQQGEPPYYRNPVFGYVDGHLSCRYYLREFVESAQEKTGQRLTAVERLALDTFEDIAARPENHVVMDLAPGDLQLVNNSVLVHARSAFTDHGRRHRELLRIWVNPIPARPLPEGFARFRDGMPVTTGSA